MQVFITDNDLFISSSHLDDKRLLKQILECKQILNIYSYSNLLKTNHYEDTLKPIGYINHPIIKKYANYIGCDMLIRYLKILCMEYTYRYNKIHKYDVINLHTISAKVPKEFSNQCDYYQELLNQKWENSNPTWTKRQRPVF